MSEHTYPAHCETCRLAYRINLVLRPPAACEAVHVARDGGIARCGGAIVRTTETVSVHVQHTAKQLAVMP